MLTETLQYRKDHVLQTVAVTTLPETSLQDNSYWVILVHGGAWRDPTQTSVGFLTRAASILTSSPAYASTTLPHIAGFASIEYRLSPHPDHPQDRHATTPRELRAAKHPDHLADVQDALAFLQKKYGFGGRYILVGHSCGATMAFQSVMGCLRRAGQEEDEQESAVPPTAILGTAGIYDLRLLRDTFRDVPAYQEIIEGAFGRDESVWDAVSPAAVQGPSGVAGWKAGRLAVLAYSPDDGLVDPTQQEAMRQALTTWAKDHDKSRRVELLSLTGNHDESWEKGEELARAIAFTIEKLDE